MYEKIRGKWLQISLTIDVLRDSDGASRGGCGYSLRFSGPDGATAVAGLPLPRATLCRGRKLSGCRGRVSNEASVIMDDLTSTPDQLVQGILRRQLAKRSATQQLMATSAACASATDAGHPMVSQKRDPPLSTDVVQYRLPPLPANSVRPVLPFSGDSH